MQKVIIDLPILDCRVDLPASQWKKVQQWLDEEQIEYVKLPPDETALKTNEETSIVYRVTDENQKVMDFLER